MKTGVFVPKRTRSGTLCSVCSFSRVGQCRNQQRCRSICDGRRMVIFCAAGNNIKGYQNEDIEPPVESNAPSGWLYSFSVCFLYGSKCGARGESIADILRDTGFFLPLFCPSDTGYFFYEIALLLCRCIVVDAKLLTNIKQRLRVSHAVFGGQREIPSSLRCHSDIFVFDYFCIFFLTFAIKPQ